MSTRSCGPCTACCTVLRIDSVPGLSTRLDNGEDLAKPAGVACKYLTPQGCGIYTVRAAVCRRFQCDWKRGLQGFNNPPVQAGFFGKNRYLYILPTCP